MMNRQFNIHVIKFFVQKGKTTDGIASMLAIQVLKEGSTEFLNPLAEIVNANVRNLMDIANKMITFEG